MAVLSPCIFAVWFSHWCRYSKVSDIGSLNVESKALDLIGSRTLYPFPCDSNCLEHSVHTSNSILFVILSNFIGSYFRIDMVWGMGANIAKLHWSETKNWIANNNILLNMNSHYLWIFCSLKYTFYGKLFVRMFQLCLQSSPQFRRNLWKYFCITHLSIHNKLCIRQ